MGRPKAIVVMGVAGCGKSTVGLALAQRLGVNLIEGDDFHSPENRQKMGGGQALTDDDRLPWLHALSAQLAKPLGDMVMTCSALKASYRDILRCAVPHLAFVYLVIDKAMAQQRTLGRENHFFSAALVESQFNTLESPVREPRVLQCDATLSIDQMIGRIMVWVDSEAMV